MATFTVNGKSVTVEKNQKLIRFLRDELHLTSVKDGCSEGACGTCHVLIDGKPTKACIPQTDKLEGKTILTVEGLSDWEKQVYTFAFGEAGAVQCGFCIPGMVISAKGLLDVNPDPTREEAAFAIRNNICRCTGYVKIIDGILLAAKIFREGKLPAPSADDWQMGSRVHRLDVEEKVLGYGQYPDDIYVDGMCYGGAVRSQYARARVLSIDTSEAEALPGVICVATQKDIPGKVNVGHLKKDQPTLIGVGEITHYLGDSVALICAVDQETVEAAKKLVKVEYEVLPAVHNPTEAAAPGAPLVFETDENNVQAYKHVSRGDAEGAIKSSKYVLTEHFSTPWTEHAFLEPECCVALPLDNGGVKLLTTDQSAHTTMHECASMLGVDYDHCQVQNCLVGGGFGGKEDMSVQHHAALLCYLTKRPVKFKLSRQESILVHPKRHSMDMDFTMGCDENGIIQGVKASVVSDTGAFASLGGPVLERACTHAAGPYAYENFEIEGRAYYTNNPPAGAFRGFGVTQTCFCTETLLNQMADLVGISPWEIRYRNAIRPGQTLPNGQIAPPSTGLVETLEAVKDICEQNKNVGIACAMKNAGVGVGIPDTGRCIVAVKDGKLHIRSGASCIGQGLGTVLTQIVCTMLHCEREDVVYEAANTVNAPDSGTTSGSRQTLVTGEACRRACQKLLAAAGADVRVSDYSGIAHRQGMESLPGGNSSGTVGTELPEGASVDWKALEGQEFYGEYLAKTDPLGAQNVENPISHVAYGYATHVCVLNDDGTIREIDAAHFVGKAINPLSCEGQIEGGVTMALGFTLTEHYPLYDCIPSARFGTLGLFRADQVPPIHSILVEKEGQDMAFGAIGIGEITTIPTAPAVAGAYFALDGEMRTSLPLMKTPYERPKMPRYWW